MTDGGLRAGHRHCRRCGRTLEPFEACECDQVLPAPGWPRDGLRATCPMFRARSSYRRRHYLDCNGRKLRADSRQTRDTFYAVYCCGDARARAACPFRHGDDKAH